MSQQLVWVRIGRFGQSKRLMFSFETQRDREVFTQEMRGRKHVNVDWGGPQSFDSPGTAIRQVEEEVAKYAAVHG